MYQRRQLWPVFLHFAVECFLLQALALGGGQVLAEIREDLFLCIEPFSLVLTS